MFVCSIIVIQFTHSSSGGLPEHKDYFGMLAHGNMGWRTKVILFYTKIMAQRRMFSHDIIASDAFLDMPMSSRELYFHLGMYADDDGFVNPKKIIRMLGASSDDLKLLVAKRFVLEFESGVVVIKHWLIHNLIRNDRYKETVYLEEKKMLIVKENKAYSELATNGLPNGNQMATQVRLGKDSIVKDNKTLEILDIKKKEDQEIIDPINQLFNIFYETINPSIKFGNKVYRSDAEFLINTYGLEEVLYSAKFAVQHFDEKYFPQITNPSDLRNKYTNLKKAYANIFK